MSKCCDLMLNKIVRYGNRVSKSNRKTRRQFRLNLINMRLESNILKRMFSFKINTRTLRTIYKKGGFDDFLQNTANAKLTDEGKKIKRKILKKVALSKNGEEAS
ncbi:50S ribosomal protein L28 [Anaplasmataceae bacterium AB001_6]|nr:50S ribosomal protein L28 [Anaplasmataceae bacterium AB001_6]